jgi:hypothetical protein
MIKGQAEIVENVFVVLFGVIILTAISTISYNIYMNQIKSEIENNLKQLAIGISDATLKLYEMGKASFYSPKPNQTAKLVEINLNLPSRVSGRNYEVFLTSASSIWIQISNLSLDGTQPATQIITTPGAKIILRTTQSPEITVEHEIPNLDVLTQGKIENGLNGKLSYYRSNFNNTIKDYIVLGEQDIIIDITKVS